MRFASTWFGLVVICGCSSQPQAPALIDEPVYENDQEGIRFLAPEGWSLRGKSALPPGPVTRERQLVEYRQLRGRGDATFEVSRYDLPADADLIEHLSGLTRKFKRDDLLEKLEAVGVPAGPINDLDQVFEDPQVKHRGMRINPKSDAAKAGSIPGVRTPITLDGAPMAAEHPAPRLGQHTAEILREIGE